MVYAQQGVAHGTGYAIRLDHVFIHVPPPRRVIVIVQAPATGTAIDLSCTSPPHLILSPHTLFYYLHTINQACHLETNKHFT